MSEELKDGEVYKQLILVVGALVVFFVIIIILARVVGGNSAEVEPDTMVEAATIERIKPFGKVTIGAAPVATASADGKGTYGASCAACHASGAAGSPKLGDKGAWKKRIAQGMDTLFDHAINGFKGMPAKGGNASLSDEAVEAAVKYMVKSSQ